LRIVNDPFRRLDKADCSSRCHSIKSTVHATHFKAINENSAIFWDVSSCWLVGVRHRLGRTYAINFGVEEQAKRATNKNSYLHASSFLPVAWLTFPP
jgi:hypothetical protein